MAIVPNRNGVNPGNPDTNGWTGVDPHIPSSQEITDEVIADVLDDGTFGKLLKDSETQAEALELLDLVADPTEYVTEDALTTALGDYYDKTVADNRYVNETAIGTVNGVAPLDGSAKLDISYLPSAVLGAVSYQGSWNASTNSPDIGSAVGSKGYYYVVNADGATSKDGITDWKIGDWIISNGAVWQKIDNTDVVTSVAGLTGAISGASLKTALSLVKADVGLGNVDNTSDADKPVSTATQAALDTKPTQGPHFSVHRNGTTLASFPNATITKLQFTTEDWDSANCFDLTNHRFTPNVAGYYHFEGAAIYGMTGAGYAIVHLFKNGVEFKRGLMQHVSAAADAGSNLSCVAYANGTTDYFELFGYQSCGAAVNVRGEAAYTFFQGRKVYNG